MPGAGGHDAVPVKTARENGPAVVSACLKPKLDVLRKRSDFLACARARKCSTPGFLLQARLRPVNRAGRNDTGESNTARSDTAKSDSGPKNDAIRVGFTASKKVGNAVARNRAKRRMRALARTVIAREGRPGWDYVLVARRGETANRDFAQMGLDLSRALARLHAAKR